MCFVFAMIPHGLSGVEVASYKYFEVVYLGETERFQSGIFPKH